MKVRHESFISTTLEDGAYWPTREFFQPLMGLGRGVVGMQKRTVMGKMGGGILLLPSCCLLLMSSCSLLQCFAVCCSV